VLLLASRKSPLAIKQVEEVMEELKCFHPEVAFQTVLIDTTGDKDLTTSLRTLGRTNFFTKEIDELVLTKKCDFAVHSAKDLPDPLHPDLQIVALTKGVDARDVVLMREGETFESLPPLAKIATSSFRRMEMIQELRSDLTFVDIRGNIGQRLDQLFSHRFDALVMAKDALIRLQLLHLNHRVLEEATVPLQGRLAVVARKGDSRIENLFACLGGVEC
jgi:hydroxymethylbilane synthase